MNFSFSTTNAANIPLKFALRVLQFLPPTPPAANNPIGVSLLAGRGAKSARFNPAYRAPALTTP